MLGLYVEYSISVVGHVQCGRNIYSVAYANNVKCMYTSASCYIDIAVSS